MELDRFKTNKEIEKEVNDWFEGLTYLGKIEVLLEAYPDLSITGIEKKGLNSLWDKISLERKRDLCKGAWRRSLK